MNENDMKKLEAAMKRIDERCSFNDINQDTAFALITFEKNRGHFIRHTKGMTMVESYDTVISELKREFPNLDRSELNWIMFRCGMVQEKYANIIAFIIAGIYFFGCLLSAIYIWELHPFVVILTTIINFLLSLLVAFICACIMGAAR